MIITVHDYHFIKYFIFTAQHVLLLTMYWLYFVPFFIAVTHSMALHFMSATDSITYVKENILGSGSIMME